MLLRMASMTTPAHQHWRGLLGAIALGIAVLLVEVVAGVVGHSVSLLADAGHGFADVAGMGLSAGAIWIANRQPTLGRSFGLYRLEILAATVNAVLLLGIAVVVVWEGVSRLWAPADVQSGLMVVVALIALAANGASLLLLRRGEGRSLVMRSAYLEAASDALGAA